MKLNKDIPAGMEPPAETKWWYRYELAFLLLFVLISVYWFYQTNYTWDDDAIGRYYNTRRAAADPRMFLDSWNRPLFIVLFYVPAALFGKAGIAFGMIGLTALSGYLVSQAAQKEGYANYGFAAVFLVFQTFLFGITRDAMTEPLAAFIISLGLWCYSSRNWCWMAIAGGLLPLARPELIILLPLWAIPLLQQRRFWLVLLLGWGMAAWWLGWYIYSGDFMALLHELLKTGEKKNRYERTSMFHHINKYVYVLGITVFFFLILGFFINYRKIIRHYFLYLQYITGFLIYVVFASVLDLGQSGGALRNLITLSPFAALISLQGLNYWYSSWRQKKTSTALPDQKNKKAAAKKNTVEINRLRFRLLLQRGVVLAYCLSMVMIAANVFSSKLVMRQYYEPDETDYTILLLMVLLVLIVLIPYIWVTGKWAGRILLSGVLLIQLGFTLWYENPDSHGNAERIHLNKMVAVMKIPTIEKSKVYCNHLWYCWASGRNPADTSRVGHIDSLSLQHAASGSFILWEPHYTSANYSNIPLEMLTHDSAFIPVSYIMTEKEEFSSILLLKWTAVPGQQQDPLATLARELETNAVFHYFRAGFQRDRLHDYNQALISLNKALALDPSLKDAYVHRAITYYNLKNIVSACADIKTAMSMGAADARTLGKKMGCVK